ncbi:hypothetical protein KC318_g1538 [Hortaea werneckii]|uniref:ASST-domain-containing protein n=1 Tax=Hortaea werneckii TaxID=91943 RepID=A0A3M7ATE2_HORWE|nr:hypothetical protein KC334_g1648 [Hortaea werneckii]KAI7015525.1 hypothetical protein KC355_g4302 [Hortaea werneckii]KAI7674522.1 hypothetical protein KC318_g1538 [Hortaea werneckii]RMY23374.1 hypothetical protein D0867_02096 [Hortaea werneckii]RMY30815.1 hypothetical protein D0866_07736 [Hortaea werneckii]
MDMHGELIWNGPEGHGFGFGKQEYLDEDVLVWWNGTTYPEPIGRGNGAVYMLNRHYEQIHETTLAGNFVEHVPNATFPSNIDLHEIYITEQGTMIVTGNNVTQTDLASVGGPSDGWVVEAQVYEIDIATNDVLFSWKSLDHLDALPFTSSVYPLGSEGYTGENQSLAWGYFHINSASPYDGGYVLSSRFLCSAIAISGSGDVKWVLHGREEDDFTHNPGTEFCYQHDIRAFPKQPSQTNTSVIELHMHDNANSPIENNTIPTSGKSLVVDLSAKNVTLQTQYLNTSGPIYATAQGNYQPLPNGNVFLGHGWIPIFEEFSPEGEILSTIQFGHAGTLPPEEAGGYESLPRSETALSYRAFKQEWIGCPRTKPDVVVERQQQQQQWTRESHWEGGAGGGVTVYVSWNGATEVDAWEIYGGAGGEGDSSHGGREENKLSHLTTVPKTGFESSAPIDDESVEVVQVKPVMKKRRRQQQGQDDGRREKGSKEIEWGCECEVVRSELITV